eukprot:8584953-Heterocapsa_arctica.AAC.1
MTGTSGIISSPSEVPSRKASAIITARSLMLLSLLKRKGQSETFPPMVSASNCPIRPSLRRNG